LRSIKNLAALLYDSQTLKLTPSRILKGRLLYLLLDSV